MTGKEKICHLGKDHTGAYLAFAFLMRIADLPSLDYWNTDPTLHYSLIADRISRDRFWEIPHYPRFVDNITLSPRGSPGFDRQGKVHPMIDWPPVQQSLGAKSLIGR